MLFFNICWKLLRVNTNQKGWHVVVKSLNNALRNKIIKVRNSILELEKDLRELKNRKINIRKDFRELKERKRKN